MEAQGIYHSISELKDSSQPYEDGDPETARDQKDRVELLEYHGEIPLDLLKGKISDESLVNPYDDEYVKAIVTIANRIYPILFYLRRIIDIFAHMAKQTFVNNF